MQSGGHGLYPRREQGTRKRGGGACESLCRGVNMLYITNSLPATSGGISGGDQPALCPPLVPCGHTRNMDQQVGNKLTSWLPVDLSPWRNLWIRTFPSRPMLDQDLWMEVQYEFILSMQHSMGGMDSPARESRCSTSQQTIIVGALPS